MKKIAFDVSVIGCGAWPITIATILASNGSHPLVWCHREPLAKDINESNQQKKVFPDITLPKEIKATTSFEAALKYSDYVVIGLSSKYYGVLQENADLFKGKHLLCLTKGVVKEHPKLSVSQYLFDMCQPESITVLSGPNLAGELIAKKPGATVVASQNSDVAEKWQQGLSNDWFRVYTSHDVPGVEWGGILKNVMAIASGLIDGLGLGYNAKAALITRGLKEMSRFAAVFGAEQSTLAGLSGLGDLIATCHSPNSRNYKAGAALAKGLTVDEINDTLNAEGVRTVDIIMNKAHDMGVEMPICHIVYNVIYNQLSPEKAIQKLMLRELKSE